MPCIFCLYDGGASGASGGQADANHQEDNTNRVVVTGKRESGGASGTGNQKSEFGSFLSNIKIGETVRQFGLKLVDDFVRNNTSPEYSDRIQFTWLAKKLDGVFEKPDSTSASGVIATIGTTAATLILPGGVKAKTVEEAEVIAKEAEGITKEVIARKALGRDGAASRQIIEREDGTMISRTHEVTKDGEVLHQHQNSTGKYGGERQFPDEWTGTKTTNAPYENYPPSFGPDKVPGGRGF